ncbi:PilZ domain-containing protein [Qipengyuania sp. DSG2-2]|uniref:PilZ domain-containing protein n=1 Tax=Qipengyuania sp. DGS2-2 TaxID=3349631 RepID=UPI0036D2F266
MHGLIGPELELDQTASVEQREAPRVALMLRNAKLSIDGVEILCIVRDVSATGIRIRAFHRIPEGKACSIELWEGQRFPIEEAWNTGDEAGYAFCEAKDLDALVYEHGPFPKRPMRINLTMPAAIISGETGTQVTIRNISQQGACVESDGVWAPQLLVRLQGQCLPDPLHAKVLWQRDNLHGLVFERTFALADFARLAARLQKLPANIAPGN